MTRLVYTGLCGGLQHLIKDSDRDEVNKREVSECNGWVCDLLNMVYY